MWLGVSNTQYNAQDTLRMVYYKSVYSDVTQVIITHRPPMSFIFVSKHARYDVLRDESTMKQLFNYFNNQHYIQFYLLIASSSSS